MDLNDTLNFQKTLTNLKQSNSTVFKNKNFFHQKISNYDYSSFYKTEILVNKTNCTIEDQKRQLIIICDVICVQMKAVLERINKIVNWIKYNNNNPRTILDEYQQKCWPILVTSDSQIKILSRTVRHTIDECNINENRLDWLLAIHKFQVSIEEMINELTTNINTDIEQILTIRIRSGPNNMTELKLKQKTIETIENMQKEIKNRTFKI